MANIKAEFWCMRVVLSLRLARAWARMDPAEQPERVRMAIASVKEGSYTEAGGMGILEPIEVFDSMGKATEKAIAMGRQFPEETFVTVLNADPEDIEADPTADGAMS